MYITTLHWGEDLIVELAKTHEEYKAARECIRDFAHHSGGYALFRGDTEGRPTDPFIVHDLSTVSVRLADLNLRRDKQDPDHPVTTCYTCGVMFYSVYASRIKIEEQTS